MLHIAVGALIDDVLFAFQWAPTLGGECYLLRNRYAADPWEKLRVSMGTHPWG